MSDWRDEWKAAHKRFHDEKRRIAAARKKARRDGVAWRDSHAERKKWWPWWLQARLQRRLFGWFGVVLAVGAVVGWRAHAGALAWWQVVISLAILWAGSGAIAWRLSKPLLLVVKAARDIGDGHLDARIRVSRRHDEMRLLADAINEMAERIEQQMADQRALLAAVSHELRTPLGHMRVLIDIARDGSGKSGEPSALPSGSAADRGRAAAVDELEREVIVLDDLVGKLLASSRLEFGNLDRRPLDLGMLVTDVATAAGVAPEAVEAVGEVRAAVDPTLVRRAIANLLDNARTHGGGAIAVRIVRRGGQVAIEIDDNGPGVPADRRNDAFRAFVPSAGGGLGLGLALVSRIAVAHGGGAWIADRPGGGARVGFTVEAMPA